MSVTYRLNRLLGTDGNCFDVAIDHGFFNEVSFLPGIEDMTSVVALLAQARPDAIQLAPGNARHLQSIPGSDKPALVLRCDIANVYGKQLPRVLYSQLIEDPTEQALRADASCVVANLFLIPNQPEIHHQCVSNITRLKAECERYSMPLMVEPLVMRANTEAGGYMVDGDLNKIIHIWSYKDINERNAIRAKAVETKVWPPAIADFVTDMESKIVYPAPFSPHFPPGEHGTCYEFRTYTYGAGVVPKVMDIWSKHIGERTKHSPLIFAGYTELGPLNQWIHVWAYKNMGERERLRAQAMKPGVWPPPRPENGAPLRQTSTFAVPAAFSPLK